LQYRAAQQVQKRLEKRSGEPVPAYVMQRLDGFKFIVINFFVLYLALPRMQMRQNCIVYFPIEAIRLSQVHMLWINLFCLTVFNRWHTCPTLGGKNA